MDDTSHQGTDAPLDFPSLLPTTTMAVLAQVVNDAPYLLIVCKVEDNGTLRYIHVNKQAAALVGISQEDWIGKTPAEVLPPDTATTVVERVRACIDSRQTVDFEEHLIFPAGDAWTASLYSPLIDSKGHIPLVILTAFDITVRKRREQEELAQHQLIIQQQSLTLAELSTPLLQISNGVVILPLIGAIDSARALRIMETLLEGVQQRRATTVIIDITGVLMVDTQVANVLIHSTNAVSLLGAQVILTGIRPEVAQTLVGLGINLNNMITLSTLQAGMEWALQQKTKV